MLFILLGYPGETFFQSDGIKELKLASIEGEYNMLDDVGEHVEIKALEDGEGVLYWYRRVITPVCLTGECKMVDVGIYWYCTGEFLGLEVYGEHLTKTDHSIFFETDYHKLIKVLSNDWSSLREYEFSDLVDEDPESVDGTSGATKKEIAEEAVEDAVYTTFTLWHLIHGGEKEQLVQLTAEILDREESLVHRLVEAEEKRYQHFLLDLLTMGKINYSGALDALLVEGLTSDTDPSLKSLAFKALSKTDLNHTLFQRELTKVYVNASINEKLQILTALHGIKHMDKGLYNALATDLEIENEWFSIKLLNLLKTMPDLTDKVVTAAQKLLESDNPLVKKAAMDFVHFHKL